jgi:hypothetical protein
METLTTAPAKPARGKMAVDPEKYVRKIVTLERELWQEVDDLRFERRLRTDNAVLKLLIEAGLKAVHEEQAEKPKGRKR